MELSPPPYKKRYLKKSSEFVAELTPEKLDGFIAPTYPAQFGDDWSPECVQRLVDAEEEAERDLIPIQERLDNLSYALAEGWCPTRVIENELDHLNSVISAYQVRKYLREVLATLQDGEADLVAWQRMTPAQRVQRRAEREREEAKAAERRKKQAEISAQQNAFYTKFFAMGISPIPTGTEVRFTKESDRQLHELELEISNLGNDLYE
jgi:chromosome segregation ATPase